MQISHLQTPARQLKMTARMTRSDGMEKGGCSEKACAPLRTALEETGHTIYTVKSSDVVYDAISSHPDIYMCKINNVLVIDDSIVMEPDLRRVYMEELER